MTTGEVIAIIKALGGSGGGGSSGGVLVAHIGNNGELDKTWNEIKAADVAVIVYSRVSDVGSMHVCEFVTNTDAFDGNYFVSSLSASGQTDYLTSDPDGYPTRQQ